MPFKPPRFHHEHPFDQVRPEGDAALEGRLAGALAVAGGLDAVDVTVTVSAGTVILAGTVASPAEWQRAEVVARANAAGLALDNRLRVEVGLG